MFARATFGLLLACIGPDCGPACSADSHDEKPPKPRQVADLGGHCYGGKPDAEEIGDYSALLELVPGGAALASIDRGELVIRPRTVDGSLGLAQSLGAVEAARDLRVADVGGDGDDDILVLSDRRDIHMFVADDAGGFASTKTDGVLPDSEERDIATGDFDGDGDVEIVYRSYARLLLREIEGDGAIGPSREIHEGTVAERLWTVEVDGTAGAELLVLDDEALKVIDPELDEESAPRPVATGLFAPGDFDGDGLDELAIVEDGAVAIYELDPTVPEALARTPLDDETKKWVDEHIVLKVARVDPDNRDDVLLLSYMIEYTNSCGAEYGDVGFGWIGISGGSAGAFEHSLMVHELDPPDPVRRLLDIDGDGWTDFVGPEQVLPGRPCS